MAGREKRKRERRRRERRPQHAPVQEPARERPPSRSEAKDAAAREQLVPLREGERPLAVTIGALIAGALGLTTIILFAIGVDTGEANFNAFSTVLYAGVMLLMAWGMWRARYWAVLGFQALLALLILIWSLLLLRAESLLSVVVALAVVGAAGTLFWFLVKALARIQMPQRRPPDMTG